MKRKITDYLEAGGSGGPPALGSTDALHIALEMQDAGEIEAPAVPEMAAAHQDGLDRVAWGLDPAYQGAKSKISVAKATPSQCEAFLNLMTSGVAPPTGPANQYLSPRRVFLQDEDLLFEKDRASPQGRRQGTGTMATEISTHGHCAHVMQRQKSGPSIITTPKLYESGANGDHPRISNTYLFGVNGKDKFYGYHAFIGYKAFFKPTERTTPARLFEVSSSKRAADGDALSLTILHMCGHKWCINEDHLEVGSKRLNDQQTACHRMLQSAGSVVEYLIAQQSCKHSPKCWTIMYDGIFRDVVLWEAE